MRLVLTTQTSFFNLLFNQCIGNTKLTIWPLCIKGDNQESELINRPRRSYERDIKSPAKSRRSYERESSRLYGSPGSYEEEMEQRRSLLGFGYNFNTSSGGYGGNGQRGHLSNGYASEASARRPQDADTERLYGI